MLLWKTFDKRNAKLKKENMRVHYCRLPPLYSPYVAYGLPKGFISDDLRHQVSLKSDSQAYTTKTGGLLVMSLVMMTGRLINSLIS